MSDHLIALRRRLSSERRRLAAAKSAAEISLRAEWVLQIEAEIDAEIDFNGPEFDGLSNDPWDPYGLTDDELLAELSA